MDTTLPDEPRGVPPDTGDAPLVRSESGDAALLLEHAVDFDTLERMLLSFAVHPHGLGAARGWLLSLQAGGGSLRLDRALLPSPQPPALTDALRAHLPRSGDPLTSLAIGLERLEAPLARAWMQGMVSLGLGLQPGMPWNGMELGAIALRRGLRPCALLIVAWDAHHAPEGRAELLGTLQRWSLSAAGTIERSLEGQRRARQAAAMRELARASVSVMNLAEALRLAVRLSTHALGARGAALWMLAPDGSLRLDATHGPAVSRDLLAGALEPRATQVVTTGRTLLLEPSDMELEDAAAARPGATILTPLTAYGRTLGVIAAHGRTPLHPSYEPGFDAHDSACLEALADLAALAIDQAERCDRQRADQQRRDELVARVRRLERLAALGERAARNALDARNALATIAAFSRRMHRGRAADDPDREYLEIVIREAARLEHWLADELDDAQAPASPVRVESLNAALQEVLHEASETLVRRRVRLLKRLSPDLPPLLADSERTRRVLRDVLHHALERVANGGRIRVESRCAAQHVVVEIAHDGPRRAGDLLEQLFVPFEGAGTTGGGLRAADQLVRRMGGEIRMRSEGEWSALVSVTLPVEGNQDRRGRGHDRRAGTRERRARPERA